MDLTDLPHQHLVEQHPQPPPVHTAGVVVVSQDLWSQELRRAAESGGPIPVSHTCTRRRNVCIAEKTRFQFTLRHKNVFTFFAQTKVCDPDKPISIHQQVVQLQIPETQTRHVRTPDGDTRLGLGPGHSPVHDVLLVEELQTEQHTGRVEPGHKSTLVSLCYTE